MDDCGIILVSITYDAWGNILDKKFAGPEGEELYLANSYYYKGYYLDKETNPYCLNTRYYDLKVGGFISARDTKYLDFGSICWT